MVYVQSRQRIVSPQKGCYICSLRDTFSIEYHLFLGLIFVGSVRCCTDEVRLFEDNLSLQ